MGSIEHVVRDLQQASIQNGWTSNAHLRPLVANQLEALNANPP